MRLDDGRVLIVGGFDGVSPLASTDLFDPATLSVTAGPFLAFAREAGADVVTVLVEVSESIFHDEMRRQTVVRDTILKRLASELGVTVDVKLVGRKTLERSDGKARRVVDRRKLE